MYDLPLQTEMNASQPTKHNQYFHSHENLKSNFLVPSITDQCFTHFLFNTIIVSRISNFLCYDTPKHTS
jgi:hypothetical protein